MHVHARGYCYRSVEMVGRHAHRRGSPSAKVLCNIQPRSISCADREATRPTSKNACRPVCSGSGVLPLGNQVAVTFIDRLLPGVSLTIRGQPPARVPSTLFNVSDGRSAPLFLLFTLQYVSSSWTTDWTIRSHDQSLNLDSHLEMRISDAQLVRSKISLQKGKMLNGVTCMFLWRFIDASWSSLLIRWRKRVSLYFVLSQIQIPIYCTLNTSTLLSNTDPFIEEEERNGIDRIEGNLPYVDNLCRGFCLSASRAPNKFLRLRNCKTRDTLWDSLEAGNFPNKRSLPVFFLFWVFPSRNVLFINT